MTQRDRGRALLVIPGRRVQWGMFQANSIRIFLSVVILRFRSRLDGLASTKHPPLIAYTAPSVVPRVPAALRDDFRVEIADPEVSSGHLGGQQWLVCGARESVLGSPCVFAFEGIFPSSLPLAPLGIMGGVYQRVMLVSQVNDTF